MKRSKSIRLLLLGSLSAAALTGCERRPAVSTQNYYTNDFYIPGAGYYHAPFRSWYGLPYNYFDTQRQLYFAGGEWRAQPCQSITNVSSPLPEAVTLAQNTRTDITRGGFGSSSGYHYWGGGYGGYSGFHS